MKTLSLRRPAAAAAAFLALTTMAFAHVTIAPSTAASGASARLVFTVPHGCSGATTTGLAVTIPEGFVAAKPQPKPGWQVEIKKAAYAKSYKVYGEAITAGAVEIAWTGGSLPDDEFDEFVISGTLQGFEAPARLAFPSVQTCGAVHVDWIVGDAKHPAPGIDVTLDAASDPMAGMDMSGSAKPADSAGNNAGLAVKLGDLSISGGYVRAMLPGQPTGGGYFTVSNAGRADDTLLSASSAVAQSVTLHSMKMNGNVMEMRAMPQGIVIPAGGSVKLDPNGLHLMFEKVSAPFKLTDMVPVTLTFAKAGKVDVVLPVAPLGAAGPAN